MGRRTPRKVQALEAELAERRAMETVRDQRDKELSDFLETAVESLHRVGPKGTILWANKAELDLLGYTAEEYVGHHISEFHTDPVVIEDILGRLLRGESLRNYPAQVRCKDGSIKDVLINSNALWQDGEFIHTRCFTRDITALRCAEREREVLLARERAARAQAEAASGRKDEFLATISHELRTPLHSILGWVHMLRGGQLDAAKTLQGFDAIERNAQAQVRLIEDLLDQASIITGKFRLDLRHVALEPIIHAAMEAVLPTATRKNIQLEPALDPTVGLVLGDSLRLQQIVWNLLSNAVKYTPAGGRVEVRLDRLASKARITVKDTGIGIEADFLPHVFDRFNQGAPRLTDAPGGLGLGLTIAQHLVKLHGGTIHAESPGQGQGAVFTVLFSIYP